MTDKRTTSAGYRFPLRSHKPSEFHQTCVPANRTGPPAAPAGPPGGAGRNEADFAKSNVVTQDEIWKQSVDRERNGVKSWEQNWGFLAEFDAKGRPKTPKKIPDHVNMFSSNVPNTNSGNYGSRLNSEVGQVMQNMEFQFNSEKRKKKLGNDLLCY